MGYVDPLLTHDPATNTIAPAAWGDAVNAAIDWLAASKARALVRNSGSQALTNGAFTNLTFDSETTDVGGCHSTSVNTSRLIVPAGAGGWYDIGGSINFSLNTGGRRVLRLFKNGVTQIDQVELRPDTTGGTCSGRLPTKYNLAAGDYVEFGVFVDVAAMTSTSVSDWAPKFHFIWEAT